VDTLSSEPKCNTPADLIIGTVDQDLIECCRVMLFAFVGCGKRTDWLRHSIRSSANRFPSHIEPVSGMPKRKLENGERRLAPQSHRVQSRKSGICRPETRARRITHRNVGSTCTAIDTDPQARLFWRKKAHLLAETSAWSRTPAGVSFGLGEVLAPHRRRRFKEL
jgi:hypothetical protein